MVLVLSPPEADSEIRFRGQVVYLGGKEKRVSEKKVANKEHMNEQVYPVRNWSLSPLEKSRVSVE